MGGKELLIVAIVRMHRSTKDVWCVLFTDCQKKSALPPRLNERTIAVFTEFRPRWISWIEHDCDSPPKLRVFALA